MKDCATIPPGLPAYPKPVERPMAAIPEGLTEGELAKLSRPHSVLNKLVGRFLKTPKLKGMFKMTSQKKIQKPVSKPKKKKVL